MPPSGVSVFVVPGEGEETGPRDHLLLLADCSRDDWAELLANTEPMRVNAGDLVIAAGEVDRSLYFCRRRGSIDWLPPTPAWPSRSSSILAASFRCDSAAPSQSDRSDKASRAVPDLVSPAAPRYVEKELST